MIYRSKRISFLFINLKKKTGKKIFLFLQRLLTNKILLSPKSFMKVNKKITLNYYIFHGNLKKNNYSELIRSRFLNLSEEKNSTLPYSFK